MNKKTKSLIIKLALTVAYLSLVALLYYFNVPCVYKSLLGTECLGCGMTRAMLSVLKLNFKEAFAFHPMFWSVPILYVYIIKDGRLFKNKILNFALLILIGIGFLSNWLIKIL